jgi:hypothetical protein
MKIAISGQMASGKDLISDYLCKQLSSKTKNAWIRTGFANAVKEVYQNAFDVDRDFIETWKRIPDPPPGMIMNMRKALQFIGDGFRLIKPDIWIEIAMRDERNAILSDARYINEAKYVAANDGFNIVIWRPGFENDDPNLSEAQIRPIVDWCIKTNQDGPIRRIIQQDEAPVGAHYYDYFMRNDGTIEDLYKKVDEKLVPWLLGTNENVVPFSKYRP